jgi:hypothetical protein
VGGSAVIAFGRQQRESDRGRQSICINYHHCIIMTMWFTEICLIKATDPASFSLLKEDSTKTETIRFCTSQTPDGPSTILPPESGLVDPDNLAPEEVRPSEPIRPGQKGFPVRSFEIYEDAQLPGCTPKVGYERWESCLSRITSCVVGRWDPSRVWAGLSPH